LKFWLAVMLLREPVRGQLKTITIYRVSHIEMMLLFWKLVDEN
jgi:hypothetical protein